MPMEGGTKTDMERIGLFSEMEYITIGDKYVSLYNRPFNEAAGKNRQMLPGGSKQMSDLQAGYFEPHFGRIFEGESYSNANQLRRHFMMEEAKKNIGKAFLPSNGSKKSSGLGSYYGTIGGPVPFFSAELKPKEKYKAPGKNLYTTPGKKGTGYGYANITIGRHPSHSADLFDQPKENSKKEMEEHHRLLKGAPFKLNLYPRDYFDSNPYYSDVTLPPIKKEEQKKITESHFKPPSPGKKAGGMKAGTFDPYPSHSSDPYSVKPEATASKPPKVFHPPGVPKRRPVESIMTMHIRKTINKKNYKYATVQSY
ncbi:cilia-and flagella-associated protein 96 [Sorex fumeus]|uniref:cilia-and flagella-associated protein 96 n=1 Tax=Sorex fumeus TaxID=62283 RepID=UPI0024ACF34E|nr:cilia-and flagella-associated protein 96 [Sorex fumeus]